MHDAESVAKAHYGHFGQRESLFATLAKRGLSHQGVRPTQLAAFDQFHTGGAVATQRFIDVLAAQPSDHVLDLGCGLGGPARMLADESQCKVTGLDIAPHFIDVAKDLTELTGQSDTVKFVEGSAVALPFDDAQFDRAWQLHVGMNVPNKDTMYVEAFRVLKPAAVFVIHDPVRGPSGDVTFPVPWAAEADASYLATCASMTSSLEAAGFEVAKIHDATEEGLAWFEDLDRMRKRENQNAENNAARAAKPIEVMTKNHRANLASGAVKIVTIVARKPE